MSEIDNEPMIDDLANDDENELDDVDELNDDNQDENPSQAFDLGFSFDEPKQTGDDELAKLRAENLALKQEKAKLEQHNTPQLPQLRPRPMPIDFDYDDEEFNADLDKWLAEKAEYDKVIGEKTQKYAEIDNRFNMSVEKFSQIASDYEQKAVLVENLLSQEKQIFLKVALADPAPIVYALANSNAKLDELAKLDDINFIKAIGVLEMQMASRAKGNKNKPAPKEHELTGSAGNFDKKLAELEAKAEKTGDRTEVLAYKRALRAKGKL